MSKSKVVLVLDVTSPSLAELSHVAVRHVLQRMYNTPENTVALVLAGTIGTEVSMINGNTKDFRNIAVAKQLIPADKNLLSILQDLPKTRHINFRKNLVPALGVAIRLFYQEQKKTHWMSENRIMLFTDDQAEFHGDMENIAKEMNMIKPQIVFKLIGPRLYPDVEGQTQDFMKNLSSSGQNMVSFCNDVEQGESITLEDAAQITGTYKTKKTKQAAVFKGCIEIASGVQLPIYMFNKVTNSVPGQSFKRCDERGEAVTRDLVCHLDNEHQTKVEPETIIKGYRYGKSYVPISKVDEGLMKGETAKELKLICTTKRANIRKEEMLTKSARAVTAPPTDATAGTGLAAFATALHQLDMVAVCRFVNRDDKPVKLCCLFPNVKDYTATLMMVEMPFSNQIKAAEFPRLRCKASEEQLSAVDKLIDSMDLTDRPEFKTGEIANPSRQRKFDCISHKLLHPDTTFPSPSIDQYINLPKFDTSESVKGCTSQFNVTMLDSKIKKRTAGEMFIAEETKNDVKKIKTEDIQLDDLLGIEVKIGTMNPLDDFETATKKLGPAAACRMMCDVIHTLIKHQSPHLPDCLRSLRGRAIQHVQWEQFNTLLTQIISNELVKKLCLEHGISLIHKGECEGSIVLAGEAELFLKGDQISSELDDITFDDDDDLLDEL